MVRKGVERRWLVRGSHVLAWNHLSKCENAFMWALQCQRRCNGGIRWGKGEDTLFLFVKVSRKKASKGHIVSTYHLVGNSLLILLMMFILFQRLLPKKRNNYHKKTLHQFIQSSHYQQKQLSMFLVIVCPTQTANSNSVLLAPSSVAQSTFSCAFWELVFFLFVISFSPHVGYASSASQQVTFCLHGRVFLW